VNQCYVTDKLLSHGALQVSFQYTRCTKRSFRWTRCSRYHCKDVQHCGKFWQQTNPPQLTINSSNFSHLFLTGRMWLLKKNIFYLKKIFFSPKTPSRAFRPNFRHCPKNRTAQMLGGLQPPAAPPPRLVRLWWVYKRPISGTGSFSYWTIALARRLCHNLPWVNEVRYLGTYIIFHRLFKCSLTRAKKSFHRSVNATFGKVGRIASKEVILHRLHLLKAKCLPILL